MQAPSGDGGVLPVDTIEYIAQSPPLADGASVEPLISAAHDPATGYVTTCGYSLIRVWSVRDSNPQEVKTIVVEKPPAAAERVSTSFAGVVCNQQANMFICLTNEKRGVKERVSLQLIA